MHLCLQTRALFVFLTVVGSVPLIWFLFAGSMPRSELEAGTVQESPWGCGLMGRPWASLGTRATAHFLNRGRSLHMKLELWRATCRCREMGVPGVS